MQNWKGWFYYMGILLLTVGSAWHVMIGFGPVMLLLIAGGIVLVIMSDKKLWVRIVTALSLPLIVGAIVFFWIMSAG